LLALRIQEAALWLERDVPSVHRPRSEASVRLLAKARGQSPGCPTDQADGGGPTRPQCQDASERSRKWRMVAESSEATELREARLIASVRHWLRKAISTGASVLSYARPYGMGAVAANESAIFVGGHWPELNPDQAVGTKEY
jgi:hypothetical protein